MVASIPQLLSPSAPKPPIRGSSAPHPNPPPATLSPSTPQPSAPHPSVPQPLSHQRLSTSALSSLRTHELVVNPSARPPLSPSAYRIRVVGSGLAVASTLVLTLLTCSPSAPNLSGLSSSALSSSALGTSEIKSDGTGIGFPLVISKKQAIKLDPSAPLPLAAQHSWGFSSESLGHSDQEGSTSNWLNTGKYGINPKVDGNIVGQLEDPPTKVSCAEDPVAVQCTGGFGGGMKATGGPMGTRVFWRRDNQFGLQPEMDGPVKVDPDLEQAFGYMYGYRGDRRSSYGVNY